MAAGTTELSTDGYHELPPGKIAAVTTYLEMTEPPPPRFVPDTPGLTLRRVERADLGWYRDLYRRVTRQKGEDALAAVQGEFCGGCNQHVPVNLINELMLNRPAICKSCGRLLYLPENYSPK